MRFPGAWPALDGMALPSTLRFERGVFGKAHHARSDYRWLATSPGLRREMRPQLHEALANRILGSERLLWWQTEGDAWLLGSCSLSRARDADDRQGLVELQVLELGRPGSPAALGALLLLPFAAGLDDATWWSSEDDMRWVSQGHVLELGPDDVQPVAAVEDALAETIGRGIEQLAATASRDDLKGFYAGLLSDRRAAVLGGLAAPLPAEAMAVLLLPLPRGTADEVSMLCRLSSAGERDASGDGDGGSAATWELAARIGAACDRLAGCEPSGLGAAELERGELMACALLEGDPGQLRGEASEPRTTTGSDGARSGRAGPINLALWGPSSSGKTVLLAQLYLDSQLDGDEWTVLPTARSQVFLEQHRREMTERRRFPEATREGADDAIEYTLRRTDGSDVATLALEDRAGAAWERLDEATRERLVGADGLALVFDPTRGTEQLHAEIERTLQCIHVAREAEGAPDARPVALCLTKADLLVRSLEDLRRATEDPDRFVRDQMDPRIVLEIERYCTRYALFPVSAIGVRARSGHVRSAVFHDESLVPRLLGDGQPFNLLRPFTWLIETVRELET